MIHGCLGFRVSGNDHQIVKSCPGLTLDPGVVEHIVSSSPTKLVKLTTDTINRNTNGSTNVDCNTIQDVNVLVTDYSVPSLWSISRSAQANAFGLVQTQ
jgi:hypothetical protein